MAVDPEYRAKIMEQRRRAADRRNAKLRASARNYDEAHRKLLARKKKWRDGNRARMHEYEARARSKVKVRMAIDPEYRAKIMEQRRAQSRRAKVAIKADPERCSVYLARDNARHKARRAADSNVRAKEAAAARRKHAKYITRMMVDAGFYAAFRAAARKRYAKRTVLAGKAYWPHFGLRRPDWSVLGQAVVDTRSPFLIDNMTVAQRAWLQDIRREMRGGA